MIAALVLAVFAVFAVAMYRRWMPAIVAVPLMAVAMAIAAGVPFAHLGTIVAGGAAALAPVYVAVIFGALLGRVTLDTGIARAIVNLAAEYGGENPLALALVLCAMVALLFTSLSGLGAIIMVGSIVLPIMMTTGVPRTIAATLFLMSFALGFIFNIANWTFYTKTFGVSVNQLLGYAVALAAIDAVALVVYAVVSFRREREYATWAVRAQPEENDGAQGRVPGIALLVPVLPLLLYYAPGIHMEATPAFALSAVVGALLTGPRKAIGTLVAAAIRGVEDVAPAVLLFMGIGMLVTAVNEPQFRSALAPIAGGWVGNPIAYVAVFGLLSPLALYRGPLNPFGVGIALFLILMGAHAIAPVVLVAAIMAVVQVQNVCDPTNTANVWVANFTGVPIDAITKRTLPYQVTVATAGALLVVAFAPALFGMRPFAALMPAALAAQTDPGFFAPASSAGRVAVGDDGTALGHAAAAAAIAALQSSGNVRAFALNDDPNLADCTRKPYAAYVETLTSNFTLLEGTDFDVGVRLFDCGGWIVGEWHDHRVTPAAPSASEAAGLAREGIDRLRGWMAAQPAKAAALLSSGAALAPGEAPGYFFTLFKTVDGNMRAYVRAGGPAFDAGLRSGDVVLQIDGKYWWEYGTYQAQARAFDGKPHVFVVQRGDRSATVQLGAPTFDGGRPR